MSTDNNDTEQFFDTPPPKPRAGSPTSAAADLATLITALKSIPSDQLKILLQAVQPTDASSPGDTPPKDETSIPTANEYVSLIGGYLDAERKIAFCGGKPNLDYTLPQVLEDDPLAKHIPKTPACHRDLTMKRAAQDYAIRIAFKPSIGKLEKAMPMFAWGELILRALETTGGDSVTYSLSRDNKTRVSVCTNFDVLTLAHVIAQSKKDVANWRPMDHENSSMAIEFVLNHLSTAIQQIVEPRRKEDDTFAIFFMRIAQANADLSYEAADKMKAELRAYKLTDVSFQDVHHFGAKFLNTERQLHNGKRWDHSLGLIFIRELSKCPSEVMRVTFIGIGERYDTALREINPLSYDEQRSRMFSLNVHISQLVECADNLYAQIKAVDGGWPPLVNIVDKKAPDINSLTKLSHAEQAALISSGQVDINNLVQSKVKELRTKDKKQLEAYKKRFAKQSPNGDTNPRNPSGDSTKTPTKSELNALYQHGAQSRLLPNNKGKKSSTSSNGATSAPSGCGIIRLQLTNPSRPRQTTSFLPTPPTCLKNSPTTLPSLTVRNDLNAEGRRLFFSLFKRFVSRLPSPGSSSSPLPPCSSWLL
ncbi:hypothetical protein MPSEU_000729200 [Mayamaea pseudoterrestris]|nr:hypothetical protein MPSEU_000729200 [Mayamaea pseudoterrestris]